jgi:hypothetical protein
LATLLCDALDVTPELDLLGQKGVARLPVGFAFVGKPGAVLLGQLFRRCECRHDRSLRRYRATPDDVRQHSVVLRQNAGGGPRAYADAAGQRWLKVPHQLSAQFVRLRCLCDRRP